MAASEQTANVLTMPGTELTVSEAQGPCDEKAWTYLGPGCIRVPIGTAKRKSSFKSERRMRLFEQRLWCGVGLVVLEVLFATSLVSAQMLGTFNGRVVDQQGAVLPGVAVTATNANTGVARTTVTNGEGLYSLPGLEPGVYAIKAELAGFAPMTQTPVTLAVNGTLTLDFKLGLAGVNESLT